MPLPIVIVANPVAGRGRALVAARALEAELRRRGVPARLRETREPGDAGRFAAEAEAGTRALVSVGGDGTLNEIVNGRGPSSVPVALLPAGTANVLGRELALPSEPGAVADMLARGRTRAIDLGNGNGRLFVALASVGFDAAVTRTVAQRRRGTASPLSYVGPAIRSLRDYSFPRLRVRVNGGPLASPAQGVVVSKTRNYAGWFRIARSVRPDDGRLEAVTFDHFGRGRLDTLRYFAALLCRRLSRARGVLYHDAVLTIDVEVDADGDPNANVTVPWQADGDYAGETPLSIRIVPGALPLLVPEDGP